MDLGLILARFVHLASTTALFGACAFVAALAPASLRLDLARRLKLVAPTLAALSLASAVAWLWFVARAMAGEDFDLSALGAVLWDTSFGKVWQARLLILVALFGATLRTDSRQRISAVLSGLAVASLGLVGHAAMQDGALGVLHRLNAAAHLLAVSAWLGGLPPFVQCLLSFVDPNRRSDAREAMVRYSRAGHFAVPLVFATGAANVALTTHRFPWPPSSDYRIGLWSKFGVFLGMTALALVNRYVFAARAGRSTAALRALRLGALAELALALSAIALVSAFATFDPA